MNRTQELNTRGWIGRGVGTLRALGTAAMPLLAASLALLGGVEAVLATPDSTLDTPLTTVTDAVGGTGGQLATVLTVGAAPVGSVLSFNAPRSWRRYPWL